jgi:katanin p60 ATPase-containing subunit A1
MNIDLSRSLEISFRKALERADLLRQAGKHPEAAVTYREAARLSRQLAQYAVSTAEKSRRVQRARDLETLAEKTANLQAAKEIPAGDAPFVEADELQAQIDALVTRADVAWDDTGGLEATKRAIQLAFGIAVAKRPKDVTIDTVPNVLLYGPPGTGKSLLAAAVSNGLQATFFNVNTSKLLSKWFGESPRLISALFSTARRRAPAVVFVDELEALFPSRDGDTSGAERRVVSTLLAELSGVSTSGQVPTVFTIGATNAPWLMDTAALSRFSRRIFVSLPDAHVRQAILEIHFTRKGHPLDFPLQRLIEATEGFSGRQLSHLAAAAVERMVAQSNPDLADIAARGDATVRQYQIKTRALTWGDVESVLSGMKPDTSPEALRRFETW